MSTASFAGDKALVDVIDEIVRLGRKYGIHLLLATQSPRANVFKGSIKDNINTKVAFRAATAAHAAVLGEKLARNIKESQKVLAIVVQTPLNDNKRWWNEEAVVEQDGPRGLVHEKMQNTIQMGSSTLDQRLDQKWTILLKTTLICTKDHFCSGPQGGPNVDHIAKNHLNMQERPFLLWTKVDQRVDKKKRAWTRVDQTWTILLKTTLICKKDHFCCGPRWTRGWTKKEILDHRVDHIAKNHLNMQKRPFLYWTKRGPKKENLDRGGPYC